MNKKPIPEQPPSLYLFFNMAFDAGWEQESFDEFWNMYSKDKEFLNALQRHLDQNGKKTSNVISNSTITTGGNLHISTNYAEIKIK